MCNSTLQITRVPFAAAYIKRNNNVGTYTLIIEDLKNIIVSVEITRKNLIKSFKFLDNSCIINIDNTYDFNPLDSDPWDIYNKIYKEQMEEFWNNNDILSLYSHNNFIRSNNKATYNNQSQINNISLEHNVDNELVMTYRKKDGSKLHDKEFIDTIVFSTRDSKQIMDTFTRLQF